MAESLRDQLLKSGLAQPKPRKPGGGKGRKSPAKGSTNAEPDLAKAYAMRAKEERQVAERNKREAEQRARARKERHRKIKSLLDGCNQVSKQGECTRHFEHRGKIRRVHVDPNHLAALNRGELGVVQFAGRYQLVSAELARKVAEIDADMLALLVEPDDVGSTDEDGIPDDLMW